MEHLEDKHKYKIQGITTTPDSLEDGDKIIVNNSNFVGRHCLTFLKKDGGITKIIKFYNKFVQSLESGIVRKKIGSDIAGWVKNPEKRFNATIPKCLDAGL